jgi:hypothetical protein
MNRQAVVDDLAAGPAEYRALAESFSSEGLRAPLAGGWSPLEVLGHVRDSIEINEERFRRIVAEDEPRIQSWDQEEAAVRADYNSEPLERVLEDITAGRSRTVQILRRLDDGQWLRAGLHSDPQWGRITIEFLANHLREHDREHLADLRRAAGKDAT